MTDHFISTFKTNLTHVKTHKQLQEVVDTVTLENIHSRDNFGDGVVQHLCRSVTPLIDECEIIRHIKHFIELGGIKTLSNGLFLSLLHFAARNDQHNLMRFLIDMGISVDIVSFPNSFTPMYFARVYAGPRSVRVLCDAGSRECKKPCKFHEAREYARSACIATLASWNQGVVEKSGNAKNVTTIIAKCIWSTRGFDEWEPK